MLRRKTRYGVQVDLYDHIIPIIHSGESSISDFVKTRTETPAALHPRISFDTPLTNPVHGRETTIFELENLLAQKPPFKIFIRGGPGIGKTALVRHAAQWWEDTEFYETVIFMCLHEQEYQNLTHLNFLKKIHEHFPTTPFDEKALTKSLNSRSTLVVLDSLESATWDQQKDCAQETRKVNRFLRRLRKCSVILMSRSETVEFDWEYSIVLGPLDLEASVSFGLQYLEDKDPSGHFASKARAELTDFKQLIGMMAGNPLAIRMMLHDLLCHLKSGNGVTVRLHIEALLNHRRIELDDTPYPHEEVRAVVDLGAQLLRLSQAYQESQQEDRSSQRQTPCSSSQKIAQLLDPSERSVHFHTCLSIMGFWDVMFQSLDRFAMMFACVNQAQALAVGVELETILMFLCQHSSQDQSLVEWIKQWATTPEGQIHPLRRTMERCAEAAMKAPAWLRSVIEDEFRDYVSVSDYDAVFKSGELNPAIYFVNPVLTLVTRSSFIQNFCSSNLTVCLDYSMLSLYMNHLYPSNLKAVTEPAVREDHYRFGQLDYWNHLALTMAYVRNRPLRAPTFFGLILSKWCFDPGNERAPLLELMAHKSIISLIGELTNVKAALSGPNGDQYDTTSNSPWHKILWDTGHCLEISLAILYELGIICCAKMGVSDSFYLHAKQVYDTKPLFMSQPSLDDKSKRLMKARSEETAALIASRSKNVDALTLSELEELRKERISAFADFTGVEQVISKLDTTNKFAFSVEYDGTASSAFQTIEGRFVEITQAHRGPRTYESNEIVQERIAKLQGLLSEDLPRIWRRNVHQALAISHSRLGEYLLAYEHLKLQREEEREIDPEALSKITANLQATEDYWVGKANNLLSTGEALANVAALIEQEKLSLQSGLQTLPWDDPSMLAKSYHIGILLNASHRFAEAIPYLQQVIEGRRRAFGMSVEGVLEPIFELAGALKWLFRLDEAIINLRPVVLQALQAADRRVLMNEYFVNAQIMLGELKAMKAQFQTPAEQPTWRRDLFQEATQHLQTGLKFHQDTYGPGSTGALQCMIDLATVAADQGRFLVAEKHIHEVLRLRREATQDSCDHHILSSEGVLARILLETQKHEEAERSIKDVLARQTSRFGISSVYTLNSIHLLGGCYELRGKLDEARQLAIEHFDRLANSGRLQCRPEGFTFGYKSLGFAGFEVKAAQIMQAMGLLPAAITPSQHP